MKNLINQLIIQYFLHSNKYEFRDFEMENVMEELEPLLKSTIENYLYLKKTNPENIIYKNVNFIQPSK
jgi:hypothetical protein